VQEIEDEARRVQEQAQLQSLHRIDEERELQRVEEDARASLHLGGQRRADAELRPRGAAQVTRDVARGAALRFDTAGAGTALRDERQAPSTSGAVEHDDSRAPDASMVRLCCNPSVLSTCYTCVQ
jgi:hypothetical protein